MFLFFRLYNGYSILEVLSSRWFMRCGWFNAIFWLNCQILDIRAEVWYQFFRFVFHSKCDKFTKLSRFPHIDCFKLDSLRNNTYVSEILHDPLLVQQPEFGDPIWAATYFKTNISGKIRWTELQGASDRSKTSTRILVPSDTPTFAQAQRLKALQTSFPSPPLYKSTSSSDESLLFAL